MSQLGFSTTHRVRHRRWRGCIAVLCAFAVLAGGAGILAWKGREVLAGVFTIPDYHGNGSGRVVVEVTKGQTAEDIAATLRARHVVKSEEAFTHAAKLDTRSRMIQPGFYRMHAHMSGQKALALILDPDSRISERVTVPEGLRLSQVLDLLAEHTPLSLANIKKAAAHPQQLGLPSYAHGRLEGFLFPATYDIDPGTTAHDLLVAMVARYHKAEQQVGLTKGAEHLGRSPLHVLTVASLVEREARLAKDYPKVARVIYNRLDKGMRLQLDSTVHYAAGVSGAVSTTEKQRSNPSPYNTYQHQGLPPGPIDSPGDRALEAALHPASGGWLYFVTVNPDTGETKFAKTNAEHERNEAEFQRWCRAHSDRC